MNTQAKTRMMEHVSNQRKLLPKPSSLTTTNKKSKNAHSADKIDKKVHMTRSQTRQIVTAKETLTKSDIAPTFMTITPVGEIENKLIPKSAISKHYVATKHVLSAKDFQILLCDPHKYRLVIKESLCIRHTNPVLNGADRSIPLYIYPDGIENKEITIRNTITDSHTHQALGKHSIS
jgi:hypothetical protein